MEIFNDISAILGQVGVILTALIVVFGYVKGPEPEATLQKILDFIKRFSKK